MNQVGLVISGVEGCATFLLADAGEVGDWAGDTNPTSPDPYDSAGSDWHRVLLDSLDEDVVEVDLGTEHHGLAVTVGETGRHEVFRTPTGLRLATRKGGPTGAGAFITSPLTDPFLGGALSLPSGWLIIMSALVPAGGLLHHDAPADLPALLAEAERSGTDLIKITDGYGGRALLVQLGPGTLSVWVEPQHSDPALGVIDRWELRLSA
ncbi:MAG: hypothetical protein ABW046_18820 [Actinoplanes sp.]